MMVDYEKYEADCKKIREANKVLLDEFGNSLRASGLSEKTINNHLSNIDFYINEFLLYEDAIEAKDGADQVSMFLGYWFIRKAMWSSQSSIKNNAASLKKFYTFLAAKGAIDKEELAALKEIIKEGMPEWLATMRRYDDPSIEEMEDVWGF
jgi:site-specific recombinase XerD